jgi:hypothetical protein
VALGLPPAHDSGIAGIKAGTSINPAHDSPVAPEAAGDLLGIGRAQLEARPQERGLLLHRSRELHHFNSGSEKKPPEPLKSRRIGALAMSAHDV